MAVNVRHRGKLYDSALDGNVVANVVGREVENKTARMGVFHIDVPAAPGGTAPTLDVDLEWYDEGTESWLALASFAQLTAAGSETVWVGAPADTIFLPGKLRANLVVGGTDPDFQVTIGFDMV